MLKRNLIVAIFLLFVIVGLLGPTQPASAADPKATPTPKQCPDRPYCTCDSNGKILACWLHEKGAN